MTINDEAIGRMQRRQTVEQLELRLEKYRVCGWIGRDDEDLVDVLIEDARPLVEEGGETFVKAMDEAWSVLVACRKKVQEAYRAERETR